MTGNVIFVTIAKNGLKKDLSPGNLILFHAVPQKENAASRLSMRKAV